MHLSCGNTLLDLTRPVVMGILNVTPDSFSDGGQFVARGAAVAQGLRMVAEGAAIIDVGGESTRPGAVDVPEAEELARILPVIEELARQTSAVICVDTSKPGVMREVLAAGATMINDVRALQAPGALEVVAARVNADGTAAGTGCAVCLMHMQGEPRSMQRNPVYSDVVGEVGDFLASRLEACLAAGIKKERLVIDPGFGFGKTPQHNLELLRRLGELAATSAAVAGEVPVLVGLSRKSMIKGLLGDRLGDQPSDRLPASLALAVLAVIYGARIIRAHDVKATCDAIRIVSAVDSRVAP
jgi:dihydropteroate synthase